VNRLLAAVLLVPLLMGCTATARPSDTAGPMDAPTVRQTSPVESPAPTPTSVQTPGLPSPSATASQTAPAPSPDVPVHSAAVAVALAAGMVVRATRPIELVPGWTIRSGQLAYLVAGPVVHGGVAAYQVQHWGDLTSGLRPNTVIGWLPEDAVAASFEAYQPACPDHVRSILDVAALQPFERLTCFGNQTIALPQVRRSDPRYGGVTAAPEWLTTPDAPWLGGPDGADFLTGIPVSISPTSGIAEIPRATWITVRGHFDDPAAASCPAAIVVDCRERFVVTSIEPSDPPATELPGSWARMAPAPIDGRLDPAAVWTGSEVVFWGGQAGSGPGAAYDPATDRWRLIASAPIAPRTQPATAWTGHEMVVLGGVSDRPLKDGAAYDPATNTWRRIAPSPLAASSTTVIAWTGTQLIAVTGTPDAAAWDPRSNTWRRLPRPPFKAGSLDAAWDGKELLAIALGDGGADPLEAAALDPVRGTWRPIAAPPFDGSVLGTDATWIGTGLLFVDRLYDPASDTWAAPGTAGCRYGPVSDGRWTGSLVISQVQAFDPAAGRCWTLPESPTREGSSGESETHEGAPQVWTGRRLVVWSGGDGSDRIDIANDGIVFTPGH
jgi:hypothetical protein